MIKHTKYIIEYPNFVDPIVTASLQNRASVLLKEDPNNTTFHRKNRGYHLGEWSHKDGIQELHWEVNEIAQKAFIQYYKDCPLIAYNIITKYGFISNYVYRHYGKSDHYNWHIDRSHDTTQHVVSFLLYLNDNFGGGNTLFLNDNLKVKPRSGSVLMFPCGPYFLHKSTKIRYGEKHVLCNHFSQRPPLPGDR